jgi:hypothetical protein
MRTQTTNLGTEIISASAVSTIAQTISQSDKAFLEFFKNRLEEILEICQRKKIDGLIVVSGKRNKDDRYIVKIMETRQYLDFPSSLNYLFIRMQACQKSKIRNCIESKNKKPKDLTYSICLSAINGICMKPTE